MASCCVLWEGGSSPSPRAQWKGRAASWIWVPLATNSWWLLSLRSEGGVSGGILHAQVSRSVGELGGEGSRGAEQEMPALHPSHERGAEQPLLSAQTAAPEVKRRERKRKSDRGVTFSPLDSL